ncbi:hypothetical protein ACFQ8C_32400 [Streptomyces sp. NPDC056503]|uniref:hypothetical protein n=1 Tax=Streptomyces sp. NPDC056503 TaxID=3345842 RepID=UPI00368EF932
MTTHFTDRDERQWQRRAEESPARPLPVGAWLRTVRARLRAAPRATPRSPRPAAPPRPQSTA